MSSQTIYDILVKVDMKSPMWQKAMPINSFPDGWIPLTSHNVANDTQDVANQMIDIS